MLLYSVLFVELDSIITAAKSTLLHKMSFRPATANDIILRRLVDGLQLHKSDDCSVQKQC